MTTEGIGDLLSLIGQSIGELEDSIVSFEGSRRAEGVTHLTTVITGIDEYLARPDDDLSLRCTLLTPERIREYLLGIREDLDKVIRANS